VISVKWPSRYENEYRSQKKNRGKNDPAVAIDPLRLLFSLIVIENCRHQDFDERKEYAIKTRGKITFKM
jgi:hypothetical protein